MKKGETPRVAARRVAEEIRPVPYYRVTGIEVEDCGGGWQFRMVSADVTAVLSRIPSRKPPLPDGSPSSR